MSSCMELEVGTQVLLYLASRSNHVGGTRLLRHYHHKYTLPAASLCIVALWLMVCG